MGGGGLDGGRATRGRPGVGPVAARCMPWCAKAHPEPPVAACGFGVRGGRGVGMTWRLPGVGTAALPGLVADPPDWYWLVGGCVSSVVAAWADDLPVNVAAARKPNPIVPAAPATTAPVVMDRSPSIPAPRPPPFQRRCL